MSQNQEIIEAKLCAYIDDELDAAGRADLEKHLAANPQHQRLIEELRRTAGLVRNLPRESAPPELAEGFNAQLERSVLLEGVSEDVAAADLKVPRWPQLVAMAAITLLTVGLAVVVYFALPASGDHPQVVQATQHGSTAVAMGERDGFSADDRSHLLTKTSDASQTNSDRSKGTDQVAENEDIPAARSVKDELASSATAGKKLAKAFRADALSLSGGVGVDGGKAPIVLVMHSDDPSAARNALVLYLVDQKIAWQPAALPQRLEQKLDSPELALAPVDQLKRMAPQNAPGGPATQPGNTAGDSTLSAAIAPAVSQPQPQSSVGTTLPAQPPQPSADTPTNGGATNGGATPPNASWPTASAAPMPARTPATPADVISPAASQPSSAQASALQADAPGAAARLPADRESSEGLVTEKPLPQLPVVSRSLSPTVPDFSISCKLTAEQAEALRATLQQPGTAIDPLPAQLAGSALDLQKDKFANLKESVSKFAQTPAAKAEDAVKVAPTTLPSTNPSEAIADATAALPPAGAINSIESGRDAGTAASGAAATQPTAADAGLLDIVIVVTPAEPEIPSVPVPATQP